MDGSIHKDQEDFWNDLMKLSIIIVNYNVAHYLSQCLSSILNGSMNQNSFEILVVDNDSYDNSRSKIIKQFPMVKWIQLDSNYGFSKAVNKAIKKSSGKYICLVNPDTIISNNALAKMRGYLERNSDTGILGAKVFNPDGSFQLSSRRRFPSFFISLSKVLGLNKIFSKTKFFSKYNYKDIDVNAISEVDSVSGSCMMISRKVIESVGLFDENFFLYFEDTDYCLRALKQGFKVKYYPKAHIIHYKGESSSSAPFIVKHKFYESMIYFYKKYHNSILPWRAFKWTILLGIFFDKIKTSIIKNLQSITLLLFDLIFVFLSFNASVIFWYNLKFGNIQIYNLFSDHLPMLVNIIFWWVVASLFGGIYKRSSMFAYGSLFVTVLVLFGASTSTYFFKDLAFSRVVMLLSILFSGLSTFLLRMIYRIPYQDTSNILSKIARKVIVIGSNTHILDKLTVESTNYQIIGYVDKTSLNSKHKYLGRLSDVISLIEKYHITDVIVSESSLTVNEIIKLSSKINLAGSAFKIVATNNKYIISKGLVEHVSGIPIVNINLPYFDNLFILSKRVLDILLSSIFILISLPLSLYYFLRGSYYSKSTKNLHIKKIHLFQSEYRLIKHIPQFANVFIGRMSIVGSDIDDEAAKIKPGIINPSSVLNKYNSGSHFENLYLQNYSPMLDLEIIIRYIIS
ncbi:MAG: hypothetical protein CBD58_00125 [bacterium TMED198]|nr:MAG: hypothetical protein CBD58_00125 [bacterium TMED198]